MTLPIDICTLGNITLCVGNFLCFGLFQEIYAPLCNFCKKWLHPTCIGMDEQEAEQISEWNCPECDSNTMLQYPYLTKKVKMYIQCDAIFTLNCLI